VGKTAHAHARMGGGLLLVKASAAVVISLHVRAMEYVRAMRLVFVVLPIASRTAPSCVLEDQPSLISATVMVPVTPRGTAYVTKAGQE